MSRAMRLGIGIYTQKAILIMGNSWLLYTAATTSPDTFQCFKEPDIVCITPDFYLIRKGGCGEAPRLKVRDFSQ